LTSSQPLPFPQQLSDEDTRRIALLVASLVQLNAAGLPSQHLQNPLSLAENFSADQEGSSSVSITFIALGKTC